MSLFMPGLLSFIFTLIVSACVIWLAQKIVLPRHKEKGILSVLALAFLWSLIEFVLSLIFSIIPLGVIEGIVVLILWIWVLKAWFNVGWLQAAAIALVAWIIMLVAGFFLGIGSFMGSI